MLDHVLPANVENESDLRLQCGNVRKVLFRTDSEIDAAGLSAAGQVCEDLLERQLVRDEVFEGKEPPGSDKSVTSFQNVSSLRRAGNSSGDLRRPTALGRKEP